MFFCSMSTFTEVYFDSHKLKQRLYLVFTDNRKIQTYPQTAGVHRVLIHEDDYHYCAVIGHSVIGTLYYSLVI